jgi:Carboxypeptidase regulatory-like domain
MKRFFTALCAGGALCFAVSFMLCPAFGQVLSGSLTGTVVDPTGASIPGASVGATDVDNGKAFKEVTDAKGEFTFANVPNGFYKVVVEHPGFAKFTIERVQVFVSQPAHVTAKLEIATAGTEVVVSAVQATVQADSVELKNSVERAQLDSMPLPTRNPLDLVKTFAGILTPNVAGVTGGDAFVHGLRGATTDITQDGINVQDNFVKTSAFFALSAPVADSIGEINVTVGGVGADAGFGSAQVSMVTQRGSNDAHGTVYWFQRNSFLNANTWFNNLSGTPRPFQLQNRLGATIGGPVWIPKIYHGKNKTFFFFAYEAYREPRSQPRIRTVMTTAAEQGLFTYTPTTGGAPLTVNLLNVGTIGNTGQKPVVNSTTMGLYTKIVPQSGYTDAGCGSGDGVNIRCIALNLGGINNQTRYTVRADQNIGQKHSLEFVFNESLYTTSPDFLNSNEPVFPGAPWSGGQISTRQVFVWALQSSLSPTMFNEIRVGFQRAPVAFAYGNNFSETGGNQILYSTVNSPIMTSTNFPQGRNTPERQFNDNFSWQKGRHSMRFGGEYRWLVANSYLWNTVYPRVTVGSNASNPNNLSSATLPGISTAELTLANSVFNNITGLLGSISAGFNHTSPTSGYVPGVPEQYTPVQQNLAFYWQDTWKVTRNLTLQYGTRWEYQGPYDARNGLVLLPQNNVGTLFGPTPVGGYFNPGNTNGATDSLLTLQGGSNGHPVSNRDLNNFAPFLGVAYSPGGNGKTVVRGSFSTHYVQDGFTFWTPSTTGNTGLFSTFTNSTPTGVFNASSVPLPTPTTNGGFPVSQVTNWINGGGAVSMTAFDPNLRTPYVFEWSVGIQRELPSHTTMEVRYVGNHAIKQFRSWSINELDLTHNGLLQEFVNAQNNYNIDLANGKTGTFANNGLAGQVPTPLLDKMFTGLAASAAYGSSTFITNLTQNNIYSMFNTIRTSPTYRTNILGTNANNPTLFPLNFFVANPWATNANLVNNAGWSYWDGLEVEVRRRFTGGLFLLANYSFAKGMSADTITESQSEGQNYQSLANTGLDKFRSGIDVRHSFGLTFSYPLPVGRKRHFGSGMPRIADAIVGGWSLNGFTHWSTGGPFSITSRTTTGSGLTQTATIQNLTTAQLQSNIGVYRTGNGVYWLNPSLGLYTTKGSTSTVNFCTAGQTTPCFAVPGPGQFGNTAFAGFTLPRFFDQDLSFLKDVQIYERLKVQFRLEAFDLFNNANFAGAQTSLDGTTFGQLTSTFDTARGGGVTGRIVQFGVRVVF